MGLKSNIFLNRKQLFTALHNPSSWTLIAVNLGLIIAVVFWKWNIFEIVFLYWVENLIIGAINVIKMLTCSPDMSSLTQNARPEQINQAATQAGISEQRVSKMTRLMPIIVNWCAKLIFIPFFIIHYGMFCYGHGVFVFALFSDGELTTGKADWATAQTLLTPEMQLAIGLLAASHLFSFIRNFIGKGEYQHTNPAALMMRPYGRIIVLHITIIVGGMLTMALGDPMGLLVIRVILKTFFDLAMHQSERNKYNPI